MKKSTIVAIVAGSVVFVALLVGTVLLLAGKNIARQASPAKPIQEQVTTSDTPKQTRDPNTVTADDLTVGNPSAKTVVYLYVDYQCPGCAAFDKNVRPVVDQYKDRVLFVYRNFPLSQIHPNAKIAAYAVEAAAQQGKFYDMKRMLYDTQDRWTQLGNPTNVFAEFAGSLGLDTVKFKADMLSSVVQQKVASDLALTTTLGLNSTPTVFVGKNKLTSDVLGSVMNGNPASFVALLK